MSHCFGSIVLIVIPSEARNLFLGLRNYGKGSWNAILRKT